jgi:hypothetical protein
MVLIHGGERVYPSSPPTKESPMLLVAQRILKALSAAGTAGLAAYGTALSDGVTWADWGVIIGAALGAGLVVWAVPNKTAPAA